MRILIFAVLLSPLLRAEWENLWPGAAPGAVRPPAGTESTYEGGRMKMIEVPQYWVHLPPKEKANGAAAVIFPGGGYGILAMEHEGHAYAKWLNERGIAGIVVKYRVGAGLGYQYPVPFLDARRAIRTVRANAAEWNIMPERIGVMGSSAGGHLASLCATRFADTFPEERSDETDKLSARPDFAILCYPVITMDGIGHSGSRKNLAGENAAPELLERLSTEKAVAKDSPPVFLLTTSDDGVDCRNSLRFATACKENKVPVALHMFEKGGHGYGLNGKGPLAQWPGLLDKWLAERWAD
ncbi:alpha/beta hydrolase [Akkermansiaceae bacterium]|nr:alpha/beta hydrolase [Akkermansiaceae bacterium]